MPNERSSQEYMVACYLLGQAATYVNGVQVDWRGRRQSEMLFYYLADKVGIYHSTRRLMQVIWGADPPPGMYVQWEKNLRSVLSHMLTVVEPTRPRRAPSLILETDGGGVILRDVWLDATEFTQHVQATFSFLRQRRKEFACKSSEAAVQLYLGPFLQFHRREVAQNQWILQAQRQYEQYAVDTFLVHAVMHLDEGQIERAIRVCERALQFHPDDPNILKLLYVILSKFDGDRRVDAIYQRLMKELARRDLTDEPEGITRVRLALAPLNLDIHFSPTTSISTATAPASPLTVPVSAARLHTLPECSDLFCGREALLEIVSSGLMAGGDIILVTGIPGIGTSEFACHLAHNLLESFSGGAYWVDAETNPALAETIISELAKAWKVESSASDVIRASELADPYLVLLNDVRVLDRDTLELCQQLVTHGSIVIVSSVDISVPLSRVRRYNVDPLSENDSCMLFQQVLALGGLSFPAEEQILVQELCKQLEGFPSAIIETAKQAKYLPLTALLERVESHIPYIPSKSLIAAFDDLSDKGIELMALMCWLPFGVDFYSLELAISENLIDVLAELLIEKLVAFDGQTYRVYGVIRQCAMDRFSQHVVNRARSQAVALMVSNSAVLVHSAITQSERQRNLAWLLEWCYREDVIDEFIKLARTLEQTLESQGMVEKRLELLRRGIEAADRAHDPRAAAYFRYQAAESLGYIGEHHLAQEYCRQALGTYQQLEDTRGVVDCLLLLGAISYWQGNFEEALQHCLASKSVCDQSPNNWDGHLRVLIQIAKIHKRLQQVDAAQEVSRAAVDLLTYHLPEPKTLPQLSLFAKVHGVRGDILYGIRDFGGARASYLRVLHTCERAGFASGRARGLLGMAQVYYTEARYDEAEQCLEAAHTIFVNNNDLNSQATTLNMRGNIAFEQSDYQTASELYHLALSKKEKIGDRYGMACSKYGIALCMEQLGEHRTAMKLMASVLQEGVLARDSTMVRIAERVLREADQAMAHSQPRDGIDNEDSTLP